MSSLSQFTYEIHRMQISNSFRVHFRKEKNWSEHSIMGKERVFDMHANVNVQRNVFRYETAARSESALQKRRSVSVLMVRSELIES